MWDTWVGSLDWEDPLEEGRLPIPVFWPGEFHGLYSPWGCKESDTTEPLSLYLKRHTDPVTVVFPLHSPNPISSWAQHQAGTPQTMLPGEPQPVSHLEMAWVRSAALKVICPSTCTGLVSTPSKDELPSGTFGHVAIRHQTQPHEKFWSFSKIRSLLCLLTPGNSIRPNSPLQDSAMTVHNSERSKDSQKKELELCPWIVESSQLKIHLSPLGGLPGCTQTEFCASPQAPCPIQFPQDRNSLFTPEANPLKLWAVICLQLYTKWGFGT